MAMPTQLMAMLSQLTPEMLDRATPDQLMRLQALLEAERAAQVVDTRPPLSSYLDDEPLTEHARLHFDHRDAHMKALQKQRLLPDDADAGTYLRWHLQLWNAAGEAADADGYPASPPKAAPEPAEPDPRPSLPPHVQLDVEHSRALERAQRRSGPSEPELDKLAAYRGFGEWRLPESHHSDD